MLLFSKNPHDPILHNHPLKREYEGKRSIHITANWRAIYEEAQEGKDIFAYFVLLGTHKQLCG
ncbi:MAG: type II toxin-antitoxin system YafQ family toxin [Candidatus Levyibacteriota bacterium]